ncbi:Chromate transport protein [compost metagenome]
MLWELFRTFFMIGLLSFGGGYAMIPVIGEQVERNGWMDLHMYMNVTAVAGMSPGPIATNTAVFVGYITAALPGAIMATLGILLPSLLLSVLVAGFFYRMYQHKLVKAGFYGLRPVVAAIIFYGAYRFSRTSGMISPSFTHDEIMLWGIFAASLFAFWKLRTHPFYVIVLSGLVGIALFT